MRQLRAIRTRGKERFHNKRLEPAVWLRIRRVVRVSSWQADTGCPARVMRGIMRATHNSHHFRSQFERSSFETDTTGGNVEAETEINMDDMTRVIDHDVSIVSIFELEEIGDDRVRGHTLDEVCAGFLEPD